MSPPTSPSPSTTTAASATGTKSARKARAVIQRRRQKFTQTEITAILSGISKHGVGHWKAIKEEYSEELANRTTVQIKDCYRTLVKRGDVVEEKGRVKSGMKSGMKNGAAKSGGEKKRAADSDSGSKEEDDADNNNSKSKSNKKKAASAKKRKVVTNPDERKPAASTSAAAAPSAAASTSTSKSTSASIGSASERLSNVNARHPPSATSLLRSVLPLRGLTGVSGDDWAQLAGDARRLEQEVELLFRSIKAEVDRERGLETSLESNIAGAGAGAGADDGAGSATDVRGSTAAVAEATTAPKISRSNSQMKMNGNIRTRIVMALIVLVAIAINLFALSELAHVLFSGAHGASTTATSSASAPTDLSSIDSAQHDSCSSGNIFARAFAPHSQRPSRRMYEHTKSLATSFLRQMEQLMALSRHAGVHGDITKRHHPNIRPPRRVPRTRRLQEPSFSTDNSEYGGYDEAELSNLTLREFISNDAGFSLAMAPSFFGFYGYFGALAALNEEVLSDDNGVGSTNMDDAKREQETKGEIKAEQPLKVVLPTATNLAKRGPGGSKPKVLLNAVAGASSGAIAAVFLSSGGDPRVAADACIKYKLKDFADFGGIGAAMKGHRFEDILKLGLTKTVGTTSKFEESVVPVAVSGFDLLTMSGKLLDSGCMARAARASATFPMLFQPVGHCKGETKGGGGWLSSLLPDQLLIDGGLADLYGLNGLSAVLPKTNAGARIVNLVVGDFGTQRPPGPSNMPPGIDASEVLSISITGIPKCGPWAMENGPRAVESARKAVTAVLDAPLHVGIEKGHLELHIDASAFA